MQSNRSRAACRHGNRTDRRATTTDIADLLRAMVAKQLKSGASFEEYEAATLAAADEAVRLCVEKELQRRARRVPAAVEVEGHHYRRHQPGTVVYHSLCGPLRIERWTYRRIDIRNGPTVVPLEHLAGLMHGATPALAYSVALAFGQGPLREYELTMKSAHRHVPSRSTLERLGKTLGLVLDDEVMDLEPIVRSSEAVPTAAHAVVVGLDRTSVPMAEAVENAERPPKHSHAGARLRPVPVEVHYRMAYVGTVAVVDASGVAIEARRYGATADDGPDNILERIVLDVRALRAAHANIPLLVIQDGAPELWNLVREKFRESQIGPWQGLIDRYHADEHLARILELLEPDERRRRERLARYRNQLDSKDAAMKAIGDELWKEILSRGKVHNREIGMHHTYLDTNAWAGNMRYAKFRRQHFPVGSGITEGACKSLVTMRAKRSGQRWHSSGLRAVLTIRGLLHSDRLEAVWRLFRKSYSLPIQVTPS